jgi:hypothetical protein
VAFGDGDRLVMPGLISMEMALVRALGTILIAVRAPSCSHCVDNPAIPGQAPFFAESMSRKTFGGVNSPSVDTSTPRGARASATAQFIEPTLPTAPPSPVPFIPNGLSGVGLTIWPIRMFGMSPAVGSK